MEQSARHWPQYLGAFAVLILLSIYGVVLNQLVRLIGGRLIFWRQS